MSSSSLDRESLLWQDKYSPKTAGDLAVHFSKKKAVNEWIVKTRAKAAFQRTLPSNSASFKPSVLVLCGCSGSCKSTLVEVTARELCVPVVQWHEDLLEGRGEAASFNPFLTGQDHVDSSRPMQRVASHAREGSYGSALNEQLMEDLNDFAIRSAYSSLQCTASQRKLSSHPSHLASAGMSRASTPSHCSGSGKTTAAEVVASHLKKRKAPQAVINLVDDDGSNADTDDIVDFDDDDWDAPVTKSASSGFSGRSKHGSSQCSSASSGGRDSLRSEVMSSGGSSGPEGEAPLSHHIILIHDPASLSASASPFQRSSHCFASEWHDDEAKVPGPGICSQLLKFQHPVVLIVSDQGEREMTHWTVTDLIPRDVQDRLDLDVVFCNPITVRNTKKVLLKIAGEESSARGGHRLRVPADSVLEDIATASLGDLRQAIAQLQMCMMGQSAPPTQSQTTVMRRKKSAQSGSKEEVMVRADPETGSRDKSYSFLHGVAKLLWAKVPTEQSVADDVAAKSGDDFKSLYKLKFPPDGVIRRLELPLDIAVSFLQFNYLTIFQQIEAKHETHASAIRPDPTLPLPSFDTLERAERFSEILSEVDMLYTCQFSTNLPLDRSESSSFPKEYVESICSRAPACSMYPTSKTPSLFHSYNESRQRRALTLGLQGRSHGCIGDSFDHLTGTHGGVALKKTSGSNGSGTGNNFKQTAIRRPASLDIRKQAIAIAEMTRDLRTALAACEVPHVSAPTPCEGSRPPFVPDKASRSFDFVVKQSACASGGFNHRPPLLKDAGRVLPDNVVDDGGCLPVSFLSSTELLTVVVPYLKCLLAMQPSPQQHSALMHPGVRKHISAMMGTLTDDSEVTLDVKSKPQSLLLGRRQSGFAMKGVDNPNSNVFSLQNDEWNLEEELEEFPD